MTSSSRITRVRYYKGTSGLRVDFDSGRITIFRTVPPGTAALLQDPRTRDAELMRIVVGKFPWNDYARPSFV